MDKEEIEEKIKDIKEDIAYQTGFVDGIEFVVKLEKEKSAN